MNEVVVIGLIALFLTFLYDRKVIRWGFLFAMILLTVFCAIRWNWGTDMPSYTNGFHNFNGVGNFWEINKFADIRGDRSNEIAWSIINVLCQPIGFFGMTILLSVFEGGVIYWFVNKYVPRGYFMLAVFIYVFNVNLMVLGCSMMRQWLAMCIVLIAVHYAIKDKFIPFLLFIFLAALFHTSALFCIVIYLFRLMRGLKVTLDKLILIFLIFIFWVYIFGRFLQSFANSFVTTFFDNYEMYLSSNIDTATVGLASLLNILVLVICIYSLKNTSEITKSLTWIYAGYILLLPFVTLVPMASRIIFYFDIIGIAVIPNGLKNTLQPILRYGTLVWIIFWYCFQFVNFFNANVWHDSYYEYNTIFDAPYWE